MGYPIARRRRASLAPLVVWALTPLPSAAAPPAAAEPPPAANEAGVTSTVVALIADDADPGLAGALDAARAQLEREHIELVTLTTPPARTRAPGRARIREIAREHQALGVFWIDDTRPDRLRVFLAIDGGTTFFRRVVQDTGSEQARLEAVWLIVGSGSLALAAGREVAMEKVDAPEELEPPPEAPHEPVPPPTAAPLADVVPTPSERLRPWISLAYVGDGFATKVPWQSGASLGGGLDLLGRIRIGAEYGVLAPWTRGDPPTRWRHRLGIHGGVWGAVAPRVQLELRVTASADLVHWRGAAGDGLRAMASAGPDAVVRVRIAAGLHAELGLGFSVAINRFDFVECPQGSAMCDTDEQRVLLKPWLVRPRARVGLVYRFGERGGR